MRPTDPSGKSHNTQRPQHMPEIMLCIQMSVDIIYGNGSVYSVACGARMLWSVLYYAKYVCVCVRVEARESIGARYTEFRAELFPRGWPALCAVERVHTGRSCVRVCAYNRVTRQPMRM